MDITTSKQYKEIINGLVDRANQYKDHLAPQMEAVESAFLSEITGSQREDYYRIRALQEQTAWMREVFAILCGLQSIANSPAVSGQSKNIAQRAYQIYKIECENTTSDNNTQQAETLFNKSLNGLNPNTSNMIYDNVCRLIETYQQKAFFAGYHAGAN